jgi:hypothetical protein
MLSERRIAYGPAAFSCVKPTVVPRVQPVGGSGRSRLPCGPLVPSRLGLPGSKTLTAGKRRQPRQGNGPSLCVTEPRAARTVLDRPAEPIAPLAVSRLSAPRAVQADRRIVGHGLEFLSAPQQRKGLGRTGPGRSNQTNEPQFFPRRSSRATPGQPQAASERAVPEPPVSPNAEAKP